MTFAATKVEFLANIKASADKAMAQANCPHTRFLALSAQEAWKAATKCRFENALQLRKGLCDSYLAEIERTVKK